jgi:predicted HTH domain antitoxin
MVGVFVSLLFQFDAEGFCDQERNMSVTISDDVLEAAQMSGTELRQELAVLLFERERLTLAQAARLAEVNRLRFQHLLASRGIVAHYDVTEFEEDIRTLRELGRV